MPNATTIVINDGKTTPVAHTFTPSKISDLVATFYGPGATLSGRESIVVTRREPTATVAGKVNIKLSLPVEATVDGQVVVATQDLISIDLVLASKGTSGNRKDSRVLAANLLQNATIIDVVDNFGGIY